MSRQQDPTRRLSVRHDGPTGTHVAADLPSFLIAVGRRRLGGQRVYGPEPLTCARCDRNAKVLHEAGIDAVYSSIDIADVSASAFTFPKALAPLRGKSRRAGQSSAVEVPRFSAQDPDDAATTDGSFGSARISETPARGGRMLLDGADRNPDAG